MLLARHKAEQDRVKRLRQAALADTGGGGGGGSDLDDDEGGTNTLQVGREEGWRMGEVGGRRQEAGGRRQEAGGRRQEAGGRKQEGGGGLSLLASNQTGVPPAHASPMPPTRLPPPGPAAQQELHRHCTGRPQQPGLPHRSQAGPDAGAGGGGAARGGGAGGGSGGGGRPCGGEAHARCRRVAVAHGASLMRLSPYVSGGVKRCTTLGKASRAKGKGGGLRAAKRLACACVC